MSWIDFEVEDSNFDSSSDSEERLSPPGWRERRASRKHPGRPGSNFATPSPEKELPPEDPRALLLATRDVIVHGAGLLEVNGRYIFDKSSEVDFMKPSNDFNRRWTREPLYEILRLDRSRWVIRSGSVVLYECNYPSPIPPYVGWSCVSLNIGIAPAPRFVQDFGYNVVATHIEKWSGKDEEQIKKGEDFSFSQQEGIADQVYGYGIASDDIATVNEQNSGIVNEDPSHPSAYTTYTTCNNNAGVSSTIPDPNNHSESEVSPTISISHVSPHSFNARFQAALDLPASTRTLRVQKYRRLTEITHDFIFLARTYAKVIIAEQFLPPDSRTIKGDTQSIGGLAGGEKFIVGDIFFKVAKGSALYNGSYEFGAKALTSELLGTQHAFNAGVKGLHFALQTVIDFLGYRLLAQALLPIGTLTANNNKSIQLGSSDALWTMYSGDNNLSKQTLELSRALNLQSHTVIERSTGKVHMVHTAADVEGHLSQTDGRAYLVDLARLFPPESPDGAIHHRYCPQLAGMEGAGLFCRLLRPELVAVHAQSLSSDAFTAFGKGDRNYAEHCKNVHDATLSLVREVIPRVAREFASSASMDGGMLDPFCVGEMLHKRGINLRHLGLLRAHVPHECTSLRRTLLVEMTARSLKQFMRQRQRILIRYELRVSDQRCRDFCADPQAMYNTIFCDSPTSNQFWQSVVEREILSRFSWLALDISEIGNVRALCLEDPHRAILFERLQASTGIKVSHAARSLLTDTDPFKRCGKCVEADIKISPTVRFQYIHDFWRAMQMELEAETREVSGDSSSAQRFREVAMPHFQAALDSIPTDAIIKQEYQRSLLRLIHLMISENPVTLESRWGRGIVLRGVLPAPKWLGRLFGLSSTIPNSSNVLILLFRKALAAGQHKIAAKVMAHLRRTIPKAKINLSLQKSKHWQKASDTIVKKLKTSLIEQIAEKVISKTMHRTFSSTGNTVSVTEEGNLGDGNGSFVISLVDIFPEEASYLKSTSLFCEGFVCGRGVDIVNRLRPLLGKERKMDLMESGSKEETVETELPSPSYPLKKSLVPPPLDVSPSFTLKTVTSSFPTSLSASINLSEFSDVFSHLANGRSSVACQYTCRRLLAAALSSEKCQSCASLNLSGAELGSLAQLLDLLKQEKRRKKRSSAALSNRRRSSEMSHNIEEYNSSSILNGGIGLFLSEILPLTKNSLLKLILDKNDLNDEGAKEVAAVLHGKVNSVCPILQHFSLWNNSLGSVGGRALCTAIESMRSLTHLDVSFNKLGDECLSEILIAAMWSRFFEKKEKSKKKLIPLRVIVKENALNRLHVLEPEVTLTAETAILLQEKIIALKKIDIDTQEMDTAKQEYRFESRIGRKSMLNVHSAEAKARHKEGNVKSGVVLLRASQLAASSRTHNYKTLKEMLIAEFGQDIVDSLKQDLRRVFRESATAVETSSMRIESVLAAFLDEVDSPSRHAVLSMPTTEPSLRSEPSSLTLAVDKAKLVQSISPSGRVRVAWSKMNSAPSISQRTKQLEETRKTRERADSGSSSDSYGTIPLQNRVHIEKKKSLNKTFSANKQEKLLQSPDCRTVDADIVVIGSANFDQIVLVDAVPGVFETEIGRGYRSGVGGKGANQALMAAKLGASVKLVCKLGMDGHADHIVRKLDENNVNCSHVYHDPNLATGMALMMVDRSGHHGLILNPGANGGLSIEEIERARESIVASNCIVLSLEIPHGTVLGALNIACNSGKTVIMRPAPIFPDRKYNPALFSLPDCVIVTQGDFDKLSKLAGTSPINLTSASTATRSSQKRLRRMTTSETGPDSKAEDNAILRALATLIMTFSCRRMVLMRHGKAFFVSNDSKEENEVIIVPKTKRAIDFSGAAGCFVGSFAFFISKGETIRDSARHAAELCSSVQW